MSSARTSSRPSSGFPARTPAAPPATPGWHGRTDPLTARVDALSELLGLSRTRISPDVLAETGELLARVGERRRLSLDHTVVAVAGATGSGKSTLFNALTGLDLSPTGVRRPTTARPVACAWQPERAAGLLDRLGVAPQDRYAKYGRLEGPVSGWAGWEPSNDVHCSVGGGAGVGATRGAAEERSLEGLVLVDLPDHDSAATGHREQVDSLLRLVDVVVWVLDPEKYADAALHERYLRPLAGHADVTVLVLNQVDRLPGDSADLVLDDLRRLLDEDGLAVGEHGEAGAVVLATSALTGQGVPDLRAVLAQVVTERAAAARRLAADMDRAASSLQPLYVGEGGAGLTDPAREEFVDRLADAVGAGGAGQSAERDWGQAARDACGTPWGRLIGERTRSAGGSRFAQKRTVSPLRVTGAGSAPGTRALGGRPADLPRHPAPRSDPRPSSFHPSPSPSSSSSFSPASDFPADLPSSPPFPSPSSSLFSSTTKPSALVPSPSASRPIVDEAVRGLAADAARGLPAPWAQAVREAARRGGADLPDALDTAVERARPGTPERPGWCSAAAASQMLLMALGLAGLVCLTAVATGWLVTSWWIPLAVAAAGVLGGPLVALGCRIAARGPARRYGQAVERRLRDVAADCGRARVLEPVAAELMRYREAREQYAVVSGAAPVPVRHPTG